VKFACAVALLFYACGSSTPVQPPTPPPTASVGAALHWIEPPSGVTSFIVLRNGVQITTTLGSALTYIDSPLKPGTYTYTIEACNPAGCSGPSNPGSITIP
jgi:hypothetical protein